MHKTSALKQSRYLYFLKNLISYINEYQILREI